MLGGRDGGLGKVPIMIPRVLTVLSAAQLDPPALPSDATAALSLTFFFFFFFLT